MQRKSKDGTHSRIAWVYFEICVLIAAAFSAWCLQISPHPWSDEGGYINMLVSFFQTGKMDLMQWSQPTYLGAVPFALFALPFHNPQSFSYCGIVAAVLSMTGMFFIVQRHGHWTNATLLALTPLCLYDFVATMPTCMSDQFFLCYLIWSFAFLDWSVSNGNFLGCSTICAFLASITRANGYLLLVSEMVAAFIQRTPVKRLFVHAIICLVAGVGVSLAMTVNPIPIIKATSIPNVVLNHEYALFDVRAAVKAFIEVLPGLLPALVLCFDKNRIRRPDFIACLCVSAICLYFCAKNRIDSPIVGFPNFVIMLFAPVAMLILSSAIRSTKTYSSTVCFIFALVTLLVMPVMPHPLTRHALPAVCSIIIAIALQTTRALQRTKLIAAWCIALVLISSNLYSTFIGRMENSSQWIAGNNALAAGIPEKDLFVNWSWFCAHSLVPGKIEDFDYGNLYRQRETSSPILIQNGRLVRRR